MVVKKKRIQVPESIAEEVKLFAKLLDLGEITSVYDLLRELESRGEEIEARDILNHQVNGDGSTQILVEPIGCNFCLKK